MWKWIERFAYFGIFLVTLPITLPIIAIVMIVAGHLFFTYPTISLLMIVAVSVGAIISGIAWAVTGFGPNAPKFLLAFALVMICLTIGVITFLEHQPTANCPEPQYPLCHQPEIG